MGVAPETLDCSVSGRVPIYISRDDRYFQDKYQAIPQKGYTAMVEKMLTNKLITVKLNTDFADIKDDIEYERLFFSGSIDEFFGYELGILPYRSLRIVFDKYKKTYFQSGPQINYPQDYDFTRSVEYKYYLDEKSDETIVSHEYPCAFVVDKNERFYPIPFSTNHALYNQYKEKAQKLQNVWFLGRLGDYKYYNMDDAVKRVLTFFKEELQ